MEEHKKHRRHSHHQHRLSYRIRRWFRKNKKTAISCTILIAAVLIGTGAWVIQQQKRQKSMQVTAGNSYDAKSGYRNITYEGKEYQFNNLITTILYAGIDSEGKMEPSLSYTGANRADSIALIVLDKKNKKMSIVAINRDTMTEIRRYTLNGMDRGTYVSHLGLAYTYGEGGEVSCENLREAVSKLFGGIPIDEYAVTNMTSIPYINDFVGGVTVTVPNDDVRDMHPELYAGAVVRLDETNVFDYLHYRDTAKDYSNEGRIERQEAFISEYVEMLREKLEQDLDGSWKEIQKSGDYLQTSITRNKYIGLANLLSEVAYDKADFYQLEGEDFAGELHDEFYVDEEALQRRIIELFYEEV